MDFNYAECIKEATHFGANIYHNICAGTSYSMAWGFMDYLLYSFIALFIIAFIGVLLFAGGSGLFLLYNEIKLKRKYANKNPPHNP